MKERYIAPELRVVTFAATERIAGVINFGQLLDAKDNNTGGKVDGSAGPNPASDILINLFG